MIAVAAVLAFMALVALGLSASIVYLIARCYRELDRTAAVLSGVCALAGAAGGGIILHLAHDMVAVAA